MENIKNPRYIFSEISINTSNDGFTEVEQS